MLPNDDVDAPWTTGNRTKAAPLRGVSEQSSGHFTPTTVWPALKTSSEVLRLPPLRTFTYQRQFFIDEDSAPNGEAHLKSLA